MSVQSDFEQARSSPAWVVLEGVHALKHAVRFGALVERIASPDPQRLCSLLAELAADVQLPVVVEAVDADVWTQLTRGGLPSPSLALARRPDRDATAVLTRRGTAPVVWLDHPTHLGNLGAAVRVAAAAGADAVITCGRSDPWHPTAVRAGAGLQFALPVGRVEALPATPRTVVAVDPSGPPLASVAVPSDAVLAFGTERGGLSAEVLGNADLTVRIPMRRGVSSLNLATAVAVMLYDHGGIQDR